MEHFPRHVIPRDSDDPKDWYPNQTMRCGQKVNTTDKAMYKYCMVVVTS